MIGSECGAMAGKVVGMLLELSDEEIAILMKDAQKRSQVVREALDLLGEQSVIDSMMSMPMQAMNHVAVAC